MGIGQGDREVLIAGMSRDGEVVHRITTIDEVVHRDGLTVEEVDPP